jgi:hypothetical protein
MYHFQTNTSSCRPFSGQTALQCYSPGTSPPSRTTLCRAASPPWNAPPYILHIENTPTPENNLSQFQSLIFHHSVHVLHILLCCNEHDFLMFIKGIPHMNYVLNRFCINKSFSSTLNMSYILNREPRWCPPLISLDCSGVPREHLFLHLWLSYQVSK